MKFFSVVIVFVLSLLAAANALPLSPYRDVTINGNCINCKFDVGNGKGKGNDKGSRKFEVTIEYEYEDCCC